MAPVENTKEPKVELVKHTQVDTLHIFEAVGVRAETTNWGIAKVFAETLCELASRGF